MMIKIFLLIFYDVFDALHTKDVLFSAASGRQYQSLVNTFEPVKDKMVFIAENGTLVMYQGKELYSSTIPTSEIHTIITRVKAIDNTFIVLCGKNSAYTETTDTQALEEINKYYHNLEIVSDLFAVDDEFIKIAVLNFNGHRAVYISNHISLIFTDSPSCCKCKDLVGCYA